MMNAQAKRLREQLREVLAKEIGFLQEREDDAIPDSWKAREEADYLQRLSDEEVQTAQRSGIWALPDLKKAPDSFRALAALAKEAADFGRRPDVSARSPNDADPLFKDCLQRGVSWRKAWELWWFTRQVSDLIDRETRIVDLGSGHGHLTAHLARAFGIRACGYEKNSDFVSRANDLHAVFNPSLSFKTCDLLKEDPELSAQSLLIGLHACGILGDLAVKLCAKARCSLAFVACCHQKIPGDFRASLNEEDPIRLDRRILGLANSRNADHPVEGEFEQNRNTRIKRLALRLLLRNRGIWVTYGDEAHGTGRRHLRDTDFKALAAEIFAKRDLDAPTIPECERAWSEACGRYPKIERAALSRETFSPLIELYIALDRAAYLEHRGFQTELVRLFPPELSPRNLMLRAKCAEL